MTVAAAVTNVGNIEDDVLIVEQNGVTTVLARGETQWVSADEGSPLTLKSQHGNGGYVGQPDVVVDGKSFNPHG